MSIFFPKVAIVNIVSHSDCDKDTRDKEVFIVDISDGDVLKRCQSNTGHPDERDE